MVTFPWSDAELAARIEHAVRLYWGSRGGQRSAQEGGGKVRDAGLRSEVTGGGHLNAVCGIFSDLGKIAGFKLHTEIRTSSGLELPGFFRPTKQWDVIVHRGGRLFAAIEMKSQAGPSFGNNFNNRTEEAIGNAVDLRHAFKAGVVGSHEPFIGYFFLLELHPKSVANVRASSDIFHPMPSMRLASYAKRYEMLIERLVETRLYDAGALVLAPRSDEGQYTEPNSELSLGALTRAFFEHITRV